MSSAATTCHPCFASARQRAFLANVCAAVLGDGTPSVVSRLAAALRARRRSRAAFRDAYEALHRLDGRLLADIGIGPDQLTAAAQARATRTHHALAATCREG